MMKVTVQAVWAVLVLSAAVIDAAPSTEGMMSSSWKG